MSVRDSELVLMLSKPAITTILGTALLGMVSKVSFGSSMVHTSNLDKSVQV